MKVFFQMTSARDFFFLIIFISFVISARLIYSTEFWGSVLFLLHPSSHTYVYYARRSYYYVRGRGEESSDGRLTRILDMRLRLLDLDPPSNRFLIRWPVSRPPPLYLSSRLLPSSSVENDCRYCFD